MEGVLWLLIYAVLFYFMMRYGCGAHMVHGGHGGHRPHEANRPADTGAKDLVCGMDVASESGYSRMYQGREYRFCSRTCLDNFEKNPLAYVR